MMNRELEGLILAEEAEYSSIGRSNIGGWHSRPDFLSKPDPVISAFKTWLKWALRGIIDATAGANAFQGTLSLSAWVTVCRAGAYHAPHSHPDSTWSGVYYVDPGSDSPDQPLSGVLEFLDPRAGVDAVTAPGDPYGEPFRVRPQAGLLLVFPSWLYHWVHPYRGEGPRIAISFNATVAPGLRTREHDADESSSGLAPYVSMLTTHLSFLRQRRIALVHGVRHSCDLGYRSVFMSMQRLRTNFTYLPVLSRAHEEPVRWKGATGHVQDLWQSDAIANAPRRTGEIGIRMALGAARGRVLSMVLRHVAILAIMGEKVAPN